jgi:hypothetical protein
MQGIRKKAADGIRTHDLLHGNRAKGDAAAGLIRLRRAESGSAASSLGAGG